MQLSGVGIRLKHLALVASFLIAFGGVGETLAMEQQDKDAASQAVAQREVVDVDSLTAQPPAKGLPLPPRAAWFNLLGGTVVPLSIGMQAALQPMSHLEFGIAVGVLPSAYAAMVGSLVKNEKAREIVETTLSDSWSAGTAVRIFPSRLGAFIGVSYTAAFLKGGVDVPVDEDTVAQSGLPVQYRGFDDPWNPGPSDPYEPGGGGDQGPVSDLPIPGGNGDEDGPSRRVELTSVLHLAGISVGWRFEPIDRLIIQAELGFHKAFASNLKLIEVPEEVTEDQKEEHIGYLEDTYRNYAAFPSLGLAVGYRF